MKHILMIEDDTALQELYKYALDREKIKVSSAYDGHDGIDKIKSLKPDMIILDIMLPGGTNGFDVLEYLKNNPGARPMPVLVLTNLDTEQKTAKDLGAVDYLVKANTSIFDVVTRVKKILKA